MTAEMMTPITERRLDSTRPAAFFEVVGLEVLLDVVELELELEGRVVVPVPVPVVLETSDPFVDDPEVCDDALVCGVPLL
jgi:hypothetical protein